jgi:hypothetical protein
MSIFPIFLQFPIIPPKFLEVAPISVENLLRSYSCLSCKNIYFYSANEDKTVQYVKHCTLEPAFIVSGFKVSINLRFNFNDYKSITSVLSSIHLKFPSA